jgi:hypothetical protein
LSPEELSPKTIENGTMPFYDIGKRGLPTEVWRAARRKTRIRQDGHHLELIDGSVPSYSIGLMDLLEHLDLPEETLTTVDESREAPEEPIELREAIQAVLLMVSERIPSIL